MRFAELVFCAATLISSFLLFQAQPLIDKFILPWFGGGAAVVSVHRELEGRDWEVSGVTGESSRVPRLCSRDVRPSQVGGEGLGRGLRRGGDVQAFVGGPQIEHVAFGGVRFECSPEARKKIERDMSDFVASLDFPPEMIRKSESSSGDCSFP